MSLFKKKPKLTPEEREAKKKAWIDKTLNQPIVVGVHSECQPLSYDQDSLGLTFHIKHSLEDKIIDAIVTGQDVRAVIRKSFTIGTRFNRHPPYQPLAWRNVTDEEVEQILYDFCVDHTVRTSHDKTMTLAEAWEQNIFNKYKCIDYNKCNEMGIAYRKAKMLAEGKTPKKLNASNPFFFNSSGDLRWIFLLLICTALGFCAWSFLCIMGQVFSTGDWELMNVDVPIYYKVGGLVFFGISNIVVSIFVPPLAIGAFMGALGLWGQTYEDGGFAILIAWPCALCTCVMMLIDAVVALPGLLVPLIPWFDRVMELDTFKEWFGSKKEDWEK